MKALIAGGGRLGSQVAEVLKAAGNQVTFVEIDQDRAEELTRRFPAGRVVLGDACAQGVLESAGALTADLAIAATGADQDNLAVSLLLKRRFAVPRVVARVNDPQNAWLFDHHWGVDIAVPGTAPLVSLIEEATSTPDTVALLRLSRAGVDVTETVITDRSRAAGRKLSEIPVPSGTLVATVIRGGQPLVPEREFRFRAGDELLLVSQHADAQRIRDAFQ